MPATLITGGAKRIGKAISQSLAAAGFDIAVHYNSSQGPALALAESLAATGVKAAIVQSDLADEEDVAQLIAKAADRLGKPITNLINNASLFEADEWDSADTDLWHHHHAVNLRAPYLLSRSFALQAPQDGTASIVNIVDQRVWNLNPHFFSYTLSKAGLWTMTQTMAQALAPLVRVNAVGPGPVLQSIHQDASVFDMEAKGTPLERSVEPEEIAQACLYLLKAQKVTGQMIAVDSGQHLGWRTPDIESTHFD